MNSNVVDLLLKLGLVGTVIGFIIMLSAITEIENFDFTLMNTLLQNTQRHTSILLKFLKNIMHVRLGRHPHL